MKTKMKKVIGMFIVLTMILASISLLIGCGGVTKYTVTINGGTGGGTFDESTECTATATVPGGKQFVNWTEGTTVVSTANPYKFTVTKDVTLKANFEDVPVAQYTVTINGGTGSGTFDEDDECTATATVPGGKQFVNWTEGTTVVSTANPYKFTVTKNVTLTANFENIPEPAIEYTVTVKNGETDTAGGKYEAGEDCTVTANIISGYDFEYWTVDGVKSGTSAEFTFEVSDDVSLVAVYSKKLATPDNSTNKLLYGKENIAEGANFHGAVEIDRGELLFVSGVEYILVHIYNDKNAEAAVGSFKIVRNPSYEPVAGAAAGWLMTIDESHSLKFEGTPGNFWVNNYSNEFLTLLQNACGYKYSTGESYYLEFQAIASSGVNSGDVDFEYSNSDISIRPETGSFLKDSTAPAGIFSVKVLDGTIDGEFTEIEAGYGVTLTLTADATEVPEGYIFSWLEYDELTDEFIGDPLSVSLSFTYEVKGDIVLRPCIEKEEDVIKTPLATPVNSASEQFRNVGAYEFDRAGAKTDTIYGEFVDYVLYYVYDSNEADAVPINTFFIKLLDAPVVVGQDTLHAYMSTIDGSITQTIKGGPGDFYHDDGTAKAKIREIAGVTTGNTYYFAVKAIAYTGTAFTDSEISVKGPGVTF